jgi:hypothetical protein
MFDCCDGDNFNHRSCDSTHPKGIQGNDAGGHDRFDCGCHVNASGAITQPDFLLFRGTPPPLSYLCSMRLAPLLLIEHSWHTSAISIIKKPSTNSSPQITGYHHNAKEIFLLQAAENYTLIKTKLTEQRNIPKHSICNPGSSGFGRRRTDFA